MWLGGVLLGDRYLLNDDLTLWQKYEQTPFKNKYLALLDLLSRKKEFRNVFYLRCRKVRHLKFLLPPLSSLYIHTEDIGGGLFIQHGFSTVVSAKKIGRNCWINQQVTIGYTSEGSPTIGDNVRIGAGAIVVGKVEIGDNVTVGAGVTVNMNVPNNALVVSQKARIIENHLVRKQ